MTVIAGPCERAAAPFVAALPHCLDGLTTDEVYETCRTSAEPELNDRLRHAVNRLVRPQGWLCEREATRGQLRRVDLHLVEMGSGMTFAAVEAKMRYATDLARATDWVVNGRNGLAADVAKLAKAGPNVPTLILLWTPYIALARWGLRYKRWTTATEEGLVPLDSLEQCREATAGALHALSDGPRWHVEVHRGEGKDAELTLDAWLLAVPSTT
ncbi:hypothetical protein [Ornithinimicrobium avium]|uniref:Uncharacterized protein n=1 Tax=Ornithinimicrobium avium TaxID=2283195 RepID=A0A345NLR9_9MICO|nr:hypothetical protein [Ornithinimicrobium avium]AXH95977.1 hypothetical protein DV701_07425 [Ornithinimicrobium avium]